MTDLFSRGWDRKDVRDEIKFLPVYSIHLRQFFSPIGFRTSEIFNMRSPIVSIEIDSFKMLLHNCYNLFNVHIVMDFVK